MVDGKRGSRIINFVLIPLLLIAVLLLPPISLGKRLGGFGSERISTAGGTLTDPDGTQVTFLPGTVKQPFGASLSSLSRVSFLEGSAGKELLAAAKAIPPNLVAKSPFYQLKTKR